MYNNNIIFSCFKRDKYKIINLLIYNRVLLLHIGGNLIIGKYYYIYSRRVSGGDRTSWTPSDNTACSFMVLAFLYGGIS